MAHFWSKKIVSLDSKITIALPLNATADQINIMTDIKALEQRLIKIPTWSENEIIILLNGAADAAIRGNNIVVARTMYDKAHELFHADAQTRNRNWYVTAMIIGVIVVAAICGIVTYLAYNKFGNLTNPNTIISIFTFAAMGSVTSILTRLSSLDLREETSRKYVIYSAISKPFVAISFACIIYLALKHKVINIQVGNSSSICGEDAMYWIAAFLCGFSERFASDFIDSVTTSFGVKTNNYRRQKNVRDDTNQENTPAQ